VSCGVSVFVLQCVEVSVCPYYGVALVSRID